MKKKILLGVLVLIGLFTITGCAGDNGELSSDGRKKETFYNLKYLEPKGYSSDTDFKEEKDTIKIYFYGDYEGSIHMTYNKGKDYSEVENLYYNEHTEKDINGTTWRIMGNEDAGVESKFYYAVYNGDLYLIELNGIDKYKDAMNDFIKNISFK